MTDLELALVDLGNHLDWAEPDVVATVGRRLADDPGPNRARRRILAGAAAVTLVVTTAVTPLRTAVADLLDFGFVDVVTVERLPGGLVPKGELGRLTTLGEASLEVDFVPRLPPRLGPPDEVYIGAPEGAVTLVWRQEEVLVTEHPGELLEVDKFVVPQTDVEATMVGEHRAVWVEGGHAVVFLDAEGRRVLDPPRLARSTLAWEEDGLVLRVETAGTRDDAHRIAEELSR